MFLTETVYVQRASQACQRGYQTQEFDCRMRQEAYIPIVTLNPNICLLLSQGKQDVLARGCGATLLMRLGVLSVNTYLS